MFYLFSFSIMSSETSNLHANGGKTQHALKISHSSLYEQHGLQYLRESVDCISMFNNSFLVDGI